MVTRSERIFINFNRVGTWTDTFLVEVDKDSLFKIAQGDRDWHLRC